MCWRHVVPSNSSSLRVRGCFGRLLILALALVFCGAFQTRAFEQLTNQWALHAWDFGDVCPGIAPDGTIYFACFDSRLSAVRTNGTRKWVFRAGSEIKSSPAIAADGTIYFGSRDRQFYAVRPDGKKKWSFRTGAWVDSSAALGTDGTIYFGSWDKNFYALNPAGTELWKFPTDGPIVSSPAIAADGTIYFGSHDNKFYALTLDGKKKWDYATAGQIISSPAIGQEQTVIFTSVDGYCYGVRPDGTLRWRLRTGGWTQSSPVVGPDGTGYVGVGASLWAITADGEKKWERGVDAAIEAPPLVLANGSICFETGGLRLFNIAPDRTVNWIIDGTGRGSVTVSTAGVLYGASKAFFCGQPLAPSRWPKFRLNARNTGNVKDGI